MTVADIYVRKSSDDRGKSVADQLVEGREAIEEHSWTFGREFSDDNRSASRFAKKQREGFTELLRHIGAGDCELLILWESSRGSRKLAEWATLLELLAEKKVLIYVVSHGRTYDCNNSRDWKILATDGVDSHAESNLISDRIRRGKRRGAASGRPAGKVQFGFRRIYNDVGLFVQQVEHPTQAALIREAARRVLAGESCYYIAVDFNAREIPSPRAEALTLRARRNREQAADPGVPDLQRRQLTEEADRWEAEAASFKWDLGQVKRLCVLPSYGGLRTHRGQVAGKASWAGIHDEETYAQLLARLNDPARLTQRDSSLRHVLSGLLVCDLCGTVHRVQKNRGYLTYTCRGCFKTAARTVTVEAFVVEALLSRLEEADAEQLFAAPSGSGEDAVRAAAVVADLEARLVPFYAQAAAGKISAAGLSAIEAELLPQIEAAKQRAQAVRQAPVPAQIRRLVGAPRSVWPQLTIYQQREAIGLVVAELRLSPSFRGQRIFDPFRLGSSRWVGDELTWAQHWEAAGLRPRSVDRLG